MEDKNFITEDILITKDENEVLKVTFNNNINSFIHITKGDDAWYTPIYPEEVSEVMKTHGKSYVIEMPIERDKKSIMLQEQPDMWYVTFPYTFLGEIKKFKDVKDAVIYGISTLKTYFQNKNNELNFILFDLNFMSSKFENKDEIT